jgi:hypothetical protein
VRNKSTHTFQLGSIATSPRGEILIMGWVDDLSDKDRPLKLTAEVAWVRRYAQQLLDACDKTIMYTEDSERRAMGESQS